MRFSILMLCLIIAAPLTHAEEASQTDWSGGDGVFGPVLTWGESFASATDVSWNAIPGQVSLGSTPLDITNRHTVNGSFSGSFGVGAADFDRDGDTDLVGGAENSGALVVWLSDGAAQPTFTERLVSTTLAGVSGIYPVDVDGDSLTDLVCSAAAGSDLIMWYRNDGGDPSTWQQHIVETGWQGSYEIAAQDVNGDGRPDILAASWHQNEIAWWRNEGGVPVEWTKQTIASDFGAAHSLRTADLDGDLDNDLVGVAAEGDELSWWENLGGEPIDWQKHVIRLNFDGARTVRIADVDNDDDPDLVAISWTSEVAWWRNDGGTPVNWVEHTIDPTFFGGHCVQVADLDGDGRVDVLGAGYSHNQIAWWHNDGGEPIGWTKHIVQAGYIRPLETVSADIDGDGDLDVFAASNVGNTFDWWEITEFEQSGQIESSILDTGAAPGWLRIDWDAALPIGTSIGVSLRSSEDPGDLGFWSTPITEPGALAAPTARYVQYMVEMSSFIPDRSPILREIAFTDEATAAPDLPGGGLRANLRAWPNPVGDSARLSFSLAQAGPVALDLFDTAGRRMAGIASGVLSAGRHELEWAPERAELPAGIYLLRLRTETGEEVRKVALIR